MSDQAVRLVLGCNGDAADSGVDRVGECKIDDARFPAEIDGWLGTFVGQFQKPAATTARENECKSVARERLVFYCAHFILPRVVSSSRESQASIPKLLMSQWSCGLRSLPATAGRPGSGHSGDTSVDLH